MKVPQNLGIFENFGLVQLDPSGFLEVFRFCAFHPWESWTCFWCCEGFKCNDTLKSGFWCSILLARCENGELDCDFVFLSFSCYNII